jgi:8-oxo-dGTP pyrophosphatase MutT (NUDIX family)
VDPIPVDDESIRVAPVTSFSGFVGAPCPFGPDDSPEIARRWAAVTSVKPDMFDGIVLLGVGAAVERGRLTARYAEVRFSAFDWWRACAAPRGLRNVFGAGAVFSADGVALLGRMAPHTAPAGQRYFPCGTPDREDVTAEGVDLDGSIERELEEETGLTARDLVASEQRLAIFAPKIAAYVRRYDSPLDSAALARRVKAHLAVEEKPELDAVFFVRSADELGDDSPPYVHLALRHLLGDGPGR